MASSNFLTEARNFPPLTLAHHCCHFKCYFLIILQKKKKENTKMVVVAVLAIEKDTSKMANSKDHNELKRKENFFIHLFREVFQFLNFLISSYVYILVDVAMAWKNTDKVALLFVCEEMPRVEIFAKCSRRIDGESGQREFLSFSQWMSINFLVNSPCYERSQERNGE